MYNAAIPSPENTTFDFLPPSSPAKRTSAQAVPSGYGRTPCSSTIKAVRSGTINNTPSIPPQSAIRAIVINDGSLIPLPSSDAQIKIAGIVKIAPAANDSPAEPIV